MEYKSIIKIIFFVILFYIIFNLFNKNVFEKFTNSKKTEEKEIVKDKKKTNLEKELNVDEKIINNCPDVCKLHSNTMCIGTCTKYINEKSMCVDDPNNNIDCTKCESSCSKKCNDIIDIFKNINKNIEECTKGGKYSSCYKEKFNEYLKNYKEKPGIDNTFYCNTLNKYMEGDFEDYLLENETTALKNMKNLCMSTCDRLIHPKNGICDDKTEDDRMLCRIIPDIPETESESNSQIETFSNYDSDDSESSGESLSSSSVDPFYIISEENNLDDTYDANLDKFSKVKYDRDIAEDIDVCINKFNFTKCDATQHINPDTYIHEVNRLWGDFSKCMVDKILEDNLDICNKNDKCKKYIKKAIIGMTTRSKVNKTIRRLVKENNNYTKNK